MTLTNRIQAQEHVNKQLTERLSQKETTIEVRQWYSLLDLSMIF